MGLLLFGVSYEKSMLFEVYFWKYGGGEGIFNVLALEMLLFYRSRGPIVWHVLSYIRFSYGFAVCNFLTFSYSFRDPLG